MKVIVFVKATPGSETGELPSEELLRDMGNYNEELVNAGIMLAGEGLKPSSEGVRVRFSGLNRTVTDGPFTETKELVAGFWIWRVKSMEEAIEWVKKCPNPMMEDSDIEIRPIYEADDLGENFTSDLREQEASIRSVALGLGAIRFEDAPARLIAGLQRSYTLDQRTQIPGHWAEFVPHLGQIPGQTGTSSYGVCWVPRPDCSFDYLTGVEVDGVSDLPDGFSTVELAAGRYAVFSHEGHVSQIDKALDAIWRDWAPDCGLPLAKIPSFERYTEEFNPETGTGGIEFWIPLAAD